MTAGVSGGGSSRENLTRPQFGLMQATVGIQGELSVAEELQDLVLDNADVGGLLLELSEYSSAVASKDASLSWAARWPCLDGVVR